jgi:hypothetical protein
VERDRVAVLVRERKIGGLASNVGRHARLLS